MKIKNEKEKILLVIAIINTVTILIFLGLALFLFNKKGENVYDFIKVMIIAGPVIPNFLVWKQYFDERKALKNKVESEDEQN